MSDTPKNGAAAAKAPAAPPAETGKPRCPCRVWIRASRPTYYVATLVPILLGYLAAVRQLGTCHPGILTLMLIAGLLVHVAANLVIDMFDPARVEALRTPSAAKAFAADRIAPKRLKTAVPVCYLLAFILAVVIAGGDGLLWILVLFAAFASLFYVCPPFKYGRRGLGEIFVFLAMGPVATVGAHRAVTGAFEPAVFALSIPLGLMAAIILFFQSLPTLEKDAADHRRTLAVILGRERAGFLFALSWPLVWLLMINLWLVGLSAWPALLGVVTFPIHWLVVHRLRRSKDWFFVGRSSWLLRILYLINGVLLLAGLNLLCTSVPCDLSPGPAGPAVRQAPAAVPAPAPAPAPEAVSAAPAPEAAPAPTATVAPAPETTPAPAAPAAPAPAPPAPAPAPPAAAVAPPPPAPVPAPPAAAVAPPPPAPAPPANVPPAPAPAPPAGAPPSLDPRAPLTPEGDLTETGPNVPSQRLRLEQVDFTWL